MYTGNGDYMCDNCRGWFRQGESEHSKLCKDCWEQVQEWYDENAGDRIDRFREDLE